MTDTKTESPTGVRCSALVRCCATCADWLPGKMECRGVEDEPAPPESVCEGWIRRKERLPHWDKWAKEWAKDKAPNK